jgi:Domain of unknown function (DUF1844)
MVMSEQPEGPPGETPPAAGAGPGNGTGTTEAGASPSQPSSAHESAAQESSEREPASGEADSQALPLGAFATHDLLTWFLGLLAAKAWEGMGLVPNPGTNKIHKNLEDARSAIDAYGAIFEIIRVRMDEQPRREMETLLTTLRVNFVEKSATP